MVVRMSRQSPTNSRMKKGVWDVDGEFNNTLGLRLQILLLLRKQQQQQLLPLLVFPTYFSGFDDDVDRLALIETFGWRLKAPFFPSPKLSLPRGMFHVVHLGRCPRKQNKLRKKKMN